MAIYQLGDLTPSIDPGAYIHPEATIIGDVTVGPESTVWPQVVLRGDFGPITIGRGSSIQDGTVVHAGPGLPTAVGNGCVVGHLAHLEGCTLHDDSLVGSGAMVLHFAVIEAGAIVGANALVPNRTVVPSGALAVGVPVVIRSGRASMEMIRLSAAEYVGNGRRYKEHLVRID